MSETKALMLVEMPFASTVILPAPSTHILWPLAVKRMVGSPNWKWMHVCSLYPV